MKKLAILFIVSTILFSCGDDDNGGVNESRLIQDFVDQNGLNATTTSSGLTYEIFDAGFGQNAQIDQGVEANYVGYLLDGTVFDTSIEQVAIDNGIFNPQRTYEPLPYVLGFTGLIDGFVEATLLMKEGGNGTFVLPSNIAYGSIGVPPLIQPNTPIVFDIEIVSICNVFGQPGSFDGCN